MYIYRSSNSRSASLAPSDSLSQAPSRTTSSLSLPISPFHQPALRPEEYPREILWCLDDCKDDDDVKISPGNESRPSMQFAIRKTDGTLISDGVWGAIKLSSRQVAQSLLSLKFKKTDETRTKTKQYFKSFHSAEWTEAITQLEQLQPLLQYCAGHWKAEHVLGATLSSITSTNTKSTATKRLRGQDDPSSSKKKSRQDNITAAAIQNMHERNSASTASGTDVPVGPAIAGITDTTEEPAVAIAAKSASFKPFNGNTLSIAKFPRRPDQKSDTTTTTFTTQESSSNAPSSTTSWSSTSPKAVDTACENLLSRDFQHEPISQTN